MLLESKYSFPLKEGQLYTAKDLSFRAWEQRDKVQKAVNEITVDPFKKLNIDPLWEFKVLSPFDLKLTIELRPPIQFRLLHGPNSTR
jgi:hypothetical protein